MHFLISDTFTASLAKLTGDEQKAAKTTAFDLQLNPASPGLQFHKLEHSKDPNFWSVRVSRDVRIVVHKTDTSLLLCYVDHHDAAYQWGVLPLQSRIEEVADNADLEDVYETERHLLYVACARARDFLLVTAVGAGSEFLEDLAPSEVRQGAADV